MSALEEFERQLQAALSCIYDPRHRPPRLVWSVLGVSDQQDIEALWAALSGAIEDLQPSPDLPPGARMRRLYNVLQYRYLQSLTQEAAAERLGITPRHLRREQRESVHLLAQRLWSNAGQGDGEREEGLASDSRPSDAYRSQVRRELESLRECARGRSADVGGVVAKAADLAREVASRSAVSVDVDAVPPGLTAAIHPSALRQMLITAVHEATQRMSSGQIRLKAEREGQWIRILLEGWPVTAGVRPDVGFIDEIMSWSGGSASGEFVGERLRFSLVLPAADPVSVVVLDDNADMVHFFRRYAAGSRYSISAAPGAHDLLELVEASPPDIIVLDVMLPDVDGWDVLMHLNTRPETCDIPVIVCSVVRERELALSLGATVYLPKPVRRQDFIRALDQALAPVAATAGRQPENTPAPC